jgi:ATP-dependent RNA circularization protein (DNA/RNA ligase family)
MNATFFKFPHTPHLYWLAKESARADKVFSEKEARAFLDSEIVGEEKIDGANIGISLNENLEIQIQNRGSFITESTHPQFKKLKDWIASKEDSLLDFLEDRYILFGEWCYATHSIAYTSLPDYFIGFDIYDKYKSIFLNTNRRNNIFSNLKIQRVPELLRGKVSQKELFQILESKSFYSDSKIEGIYLRKEFESALLERCKLVRPDFTQSIETHWSKGALKINLLHLSLHL